MPGTEAQNVWLRRVLGWDAAASAPPEASAGNPQQVWRAAKDLVDIRLNRLARIMRGIGDDGLDVIAELGLFAVTGGTQTVALTRALLEYGRSPPDGRANAASAVRKAAAEYQAIIASSPIAELIDSNPFGVDVAMVATLSGALERIQRSLA
jgi:hypothetical protein